MNPEADPITPGIVREARANDSIVPHDGQNEASRDFIWVIPKSAEARTLRGGARLRYDNPLICWQLSIPVLPDMRDIDSQANKRYVST